METLSQTQTSHISPESLEVLSGLLHKIEHGIELTNAENEVWNKVKAILNE